MVTCPNCKNEVSSSAITCPNCNHQLQTPKPIPFYEQAYLQRGPLAPRKIAVYALLLSIVTFAFFPATLKIYGFAVAIAVNLVSIARGCYGTGTISLIISVVLTVVGSGL
jgi:hypothetical protein